MELPGCGVFSAFMSSRSPSRLVSGNKGHTPVRVTFSSTHGPGLVVQQFGAAYDDFIDRYIANIAGKPERKTEIQLVVLA